MKDKRQYIQTHEVFRLEKGRSFFAATALVKPKDPKKASN